MYDPRLRTNLSEPAKKHDGSLDAQNECAVSYGDVYVGINEHKQYHEPLYVEGIHLEAVDDVVHLRPDQALSLCDWLIQERPTLERLAKEQKG